MNKQSLVCSVAQNGNELNLEHNGDGCHSGTKCESLGTAGRLGSRLAPFEVGVFVVKRNKAAETVSFDRFVLRQELESARERVPRDFVEVDPDHVGSEMPIKEVNLVGNVRERRPPVIEGKLAEFRSNVANLSVEIGRHVPGWVDSTAVCNETRRSDRAQCVRT